MAFDSLNKDIPPISGAIGITRLKVYTSKGPDGLPGGCPHMHFACTETYAVVAGKGAVQTLGYGGFQEVSLELGQLVWFTPGIIHRLINGDGELEILVIMQNAGLPEAGDHVLSFPPEVLANNEEYFRRASLATAEGHVYAAGEEAAFSRRDLAVEGFNDLRERVELQGPSAMDGFYRRGLELIQSKLAHWRQVWKQSAWTTVKETESYFKAIELGERQHLHRGRVYSLQANCETPRFGFCGWLSPYDLEGTVCGP